MIQFNDLQISSYPDLSMVGQKQQAQYADVKNKLQCLQIPYAMLYPVRLKIVARVETHFFDNPKTTLQWLNSISTTLVVYVLHVYIFFFLQKWRAV